MLMFSPLCSRCLSECHSLQSKKKKDTQAITELNRLVLFLWDPELRRNIFFSLDTKNFKLFLKNYKWNALDGHAVEQCYCSCLTARRSSVIWFDTNFLYYVWLWIRRSSYLTQGVVGSIPEPLPPVNHMCACVFEWLFVPICGSIMDWTTVLIWLQLLPHFYSPDKD